MQNILNRTTGWGLALALLLVPLIAMQFTKEVNWKTGDFVLFGAMLALIGGGIEVAMRLTAKTRDRVIATGVLVAAFLLAWVELAVGIFH